MKTRFLFLTVVSAALALPALAVDPKPAAAPQRIGTNERVKILTVALSLKPDQEEGVRDIYEKNEAPRKKLRADQNLEDDDRKARLRALAKAEREKIKAILTPEQKAKWEDILAKNAATKAAGGGAAKPQDPKKSQPAAEEK